MLDFINGITTPPRVAARIILTSRQLKRILSVLQENIRLYEKAFEAIPAKTENASSKKPMPATSMPSCMFRANFWEGVIRTP